MAKGTPTPDNATTMPEAVAKPWVAKPLLGEAMTKAKEAGKGYWGAPVGQPSNITAQYMAPTASTTATSTNALTTPRDRFAHMIGDNWSNGGSQSRSSDAGYTTSGRGWGGNSSANSGYGMGGRDWK